MAQRRMISKSISTSKKLSKVSMLSKLIYTWTIPHTDDYGRMDGDAGSIKAIVVPREDLTLAEINDSLVELEKAGLIDRYEAAGEQYLEIMEFDQHQTFKTDRPRVAKFPDRKPLDSTRKPNGTIVRSKLSKVKLSKVKLSKGAKAFTPPTLQEVKQYCDERKNGIDPQAFVDFYETTNWMRGKNKIKDWKACVRTWEGRDRQKSAPAKSSRELTPEEKNEIKRLKSWNENQSSPMPDFDPTKLVIKHGAETIKKAREAHGHEDNGFSRFWLHLRGECRCNNKQQ